MSNSSCGSGSVSYGQLWFGGSTFPGFLYKRNLGVGGRRSTKMTPGGNITCNQPTDLWNKYTPGAGGRGERWLRANNVAPTQFIPPARF